MVAILPQLILGTVGIKVAKLIICELAVKQPWVAALPLCCGLKISSVFGVTTASCTAWLSTACWAAAKPCGFFVSPHSKAAAFTSLVTDEAGEVLPDVVIVDVAGVDVLVAAGDVMVC